MRQIDFFAGYVIFITCAFLPYQSLAQAEHTSVQSLLEQAITQGQSQGVISGQASEPFNKPWPAIAQQTPVELSISRIQKFDAQCARLNLQWVSLGSDAQAASRRFGFAINICADGSPALQGMPLANTPSAPTTAAESGEDKKGTP